MAYSKQTWHDTAEGGTPVNAARLNHIEDGLDTESNERLAGDATTLASAGADATAKANSAQASAISAAAVDAATRVAAENARALQAEADAQATAISASTTTASLDASAKVAVETERAMNAEAIVTADIAAKLSATDPSVTNTRVPTDGSVTTAKINDAGLDPVVITGTAIISSDSRLTDSRPPTAHNHTDRVSKSGDTMTGPLVLSGNASTDLQAIPKQQMDAGDTTTVTFAVQRANHTGTQNESTVTGLVADLAAKETPSGAQTKADAAQAAAIGLSVQRAANGNDFADGGSTRANIRVPILSSVQAVATANVTLSGLQTIDGVVLLANDRVLCAGQTSAPQNGPWLAQAGGWTRPTDYPSGAVIRGRIVQVNGGSPSNVGLWQMTTTATVTIDTTATSWALIASGSGAVSSVNARTGAVSGLAEKSQQGTTLGTSSLDGSGNLVLNVATDWGIHSGVPYWAPGAVTAGEEAVLVVDPAGNLVFVLLSALTLTATPQTPLLVAHDLNDLHNAATARTNMGLGSAATHDAGDFVTSATLAGYSLAPTKQKLAAPVSVANTTTVDLFSFPVVANAEYEYIVFVLYDGSTTGDVRIAFQVPSGATFEGYQQVLTSSAAGGTSAQSYAAISVAGATIFGAVGAGVGVPYKGAGTLYTGSTATTNFRFQGAQGTSDATPTIFHKGSWMTLLRVA